MPRNYEPEFKKKIVRLHLEEGRTYASIREEYGISKSAISSWCNEFSKECQKQADIDNDVKTDLDIMKENLRLRVNVNIKMYKKWKIKMYIYPCYASAS